MFDTIWKNEKEKERKKKDSSYYTKPFHSRSDENEFDKRRKEKICTFVSLYTLSVKTKQFRITNK